MKFLDVLHFASGSLRGNRTRTLLMILAMSIGVAAVVVLTSLGEGARRYVINQFASLGTNLVIVLPGRTETADPARDIAGRCGGGVARSRCQTYRAVDGRFGHALAGCAEP
jgi:putative ABC transport system permease protein